jgi:hypothetical protein
MSGAAVVAGPRAGGFDAAATARLIARLLPAALLAGAYGSQYIGGLYP